MRYLKWLILAGIASIFLCILHYTLPQRDIVRILDAYEKRMDIASDSFFWAITDTGTLQSDTRDVRFIDTVMADGSIMVFRNEDTGFHWPPYFKFNSADVSAQAKQLISSEENTKWVAIRHYGWRFKPWSIFPNVTSLKQVSGPDVTLFPWFNIILLIVLGLCVLGCYRLCQRAIRRIKLLFKSDY